MKITIEVDGYKVEAKRQVAKKVWLVREFSGSQALQINTYATTTKQLKKTIQSIIKKEN